MSAPLSYILINKLIVTFNIVELVMWLNITLFILTKCNYIVCLHKLNQIMWFIFHMHVMYVPIYHRNYVHTLLFIIVVATLQHIHVCTVLHLYWHNQNRYFILIIIYYDHVMLDMLLFINHKFVYKLFLPSSNNLHI